MALRSQVFGLDEQELIDYVRDNLGAGAWKVELTEDQIKQAINEAMRRYSRRIPITGFEKLTLSTNVSKYTLNYDTGFGVYNVEFVAPDPKPSAIFYANLLDVAPIRTNRFADYDYFLRWRKTFMRVTSVEPDWFYDDNEHSLWIYNPLTDYQAGVFTYHPRLLSEVHPSHEEWVRDYTLARSKYILGLNRSKFQGAIPGPSRDITTDGQELKTEAQDKMKELEERLLSMQHDQPPIFA